MGNTRRTPRSQSRTQRVRAAAPKQSAQAQQPLQSGVYLAGARNGHRFFHILPDWVDVAKPPGFTPLAEPTVRGWLRDALLLKHIWASPNLIWVAISLAMYFGMPYDLSPGGTAAQGPLSWAFFRPRWLLWMAVVFSYTAFWHVTLYGFEWARRPFLAERPYRLSKVLHNLAWFVSGITIWVAFDNVFAFLWASGRLPYLSDAAALATWSGSFRFVAGLVRCALSVRVGC